MSCALCPPPKSAVLQKLRAALVCLSLIATSAALAHDGHVHADEESGAVAATVAASAAAGDTAGRTVIELLSERYEAVVQSHGDHLDIWLDRYDTNDPVTGARVVVTVGESAEVVAEEETPGQYRAPITPLTPGLFSTITGTPAHLAVSRSATSRAVMSVAPPTGYGTRIFTGRFG